MLQIKQSEATAARRRIPIALVDDTDGKTAETGVTISAGDLKISKNGGAEANHGGSLTELAGGDYYYEATQGECDTFGYLTGRLVKSGVRTFRFQAQIVAFDPYDATNLGLSFDAVWTVATRTLTAFDASFKTGYVLSATGVQAIWDALTSALTTVGSIGKLLIDNINATIASRSSHAAADVWTVATRLLTAGTNIVLAKNTGVTGFNDLDEAGVRSAVGLSSANLDTQLSALSQFIDTEIAQIVTLLTTNRGEPGQGNPPVSTDVLTKVDYLYKTWRNKKDNNGTESKLYADDGATVDHKQTTSVNAGTVTKGEWMTGA